MIKLVFLVITAAAFAQNANALQCWYCSSDVDRDCRDPFNATTILNGRGGGNYDNFQQNYNNQNNQNYNNNNNPGYNNQNYNGQNPSNYNPNYPQRNFQNFNSQSGGPRLQNCNEDEARLRRMRNVCIKKITKSPNNVVNIIRRCEMVAHDAKVGTCYDPVSRGITLEACELCEYDGCNTASVFKTNIVLAALIPILLFLFSRH